MVSRSGWCIYKQDKWGNTYGWGVGEYSTPEVWLGEAFTSRVYDKKPEESFERIFRHLKDILPWADDKDIKKLLK